MKKTILIVSGVILLILISLALAVTLLKKEAAVQNKETAIYTAPEGYPSMISTLLRTAKIRKGDTIPADGVIIEISDLRYDSLDVEPAVSNVIVVPEDQTTTLFGQTWPNVSLPEAAIKEDQLLDIIDGYIVYSSDLRGNSTGHTIQKSTWPITSAEEIVYVMGSGEDAIAFYRVWKTVAQEGNGRIARSWTLYIDALTGKVLRTLPNFIN